MQTDFESPSLRRLKIQYTCATDIGGGRENQDSHFTYHDERENILVVGVLDGHGIDCGKLASASISAMMREYFEREVESLKCAPYETIVRAFVLANEYLKKIIKEDLGKRDFVIKEEHGYLIKRYVRSSVTNPSSWSNVSGGTTCTIIAIINNKLYSANVGDSSAMLFAKDPIFNPSQHVQYLGDAAVPGRTSQVVCAQDSEFLELTAEHSPENLDEYKRISLHTPPTGVTRVRFIYDSPCTPYKYSCTPIYATLPTGEIGITQQGHYHKNVREEFASLLTAPHDARFPVSLSMTRALGDYFMQSYGISHLPEVQCVDLEQFSSNTQPIHLLVASDGLWDCWKYEDIAKKMLEIGTSIDSGSQSFAKRIIRENDIIAKRLFGNNSDNATAIVVTRNIS
jgi:serine/threonine protein phosphatase PrpC